MHTQSEVRVGVFVLAAIALFFFMTIQIGVFRFDRNNYKQYIIYFDDVSGLEKKAVVRIAGVDVGWIDHVDLIEGPPYRARAIARIAKKFPIYADASAVVRQEGLLGTKYIEINSGSSYLPELTEGQAMGKVGRESVSVDDILHTLKGITNHVQEITSSLKTAFAGPESTQEMRATLSNVSQASERIAHLSSMIDQVVTGNQEAIQGVISSVADLAEQMRSNLPALSGDMQRLSQKIENDFLPSFQHSIERISSSFDRDLSSAAQQVERTTRALEDTVVQAQGGLKDVNDIMGKINEGKGVLGKLINEESAYHDLKDALSGLKNYFAKVDQLTVVLDTHGEYMYRKAEHAPFRESKGYFDVRLYPDEDHFYILQLVGSQKGSLKRKSVIRNWYDEHGNQFLPSKFFEQSRFLGELVGRIDTIERDLDSFKYGLQVGKLFKNVALRFGMFESSVGFGVDIEIPFDTDQFRWITSLELFDFRGRDRIDDPRPHIKWLNRVFLLRNIYFSFGADDFFSRHNANAFCGLGIRFADDDLKYVASKLGFLAGS